MTDIHEAEPADLSSIRELLDAARLPHSDLVDGTAVRFWIARDAGLSGAVGLEPFGNSGLLRSLVVAPSARGSGLGGRLVQAVETAAIAAGMNRLVLLTNTADDFFANRGYAVIERASVPAEVLEATEFRSLCPATATCMSKTLR